MKQPDFTEHYRWNMNAAFMQQLDQRRNEKAKFAIEGDIWSWFRVNMEIYSSICPLITDDEKSLIEPEFKKLNGVLKGMEMNNSMHSFKQTGKLNMLTQAETLLQSLDKELLKLMFKYELIYIKPKKKTVEEYLAEDDYLY